MKFMRVFITTCPAWGGAVIGTSIILPEPSWPIFLIIGIALLVSQTYSSLSIQKIERKSAYSEGWFDGSMQQVDKCEEHMRESYQRRRVRHENLHQDEEW